MHLLELPGVRCRFLRAFREFITVLRRSGEITKRTQTNPFWRSNPKRAKSRASTKRTHFSPHQNQLATNEHEYTRKLPWESHAPPALAFLLGFVAFITLLLGGRKVKLPNEPNRTPLPPTGLPFRPPNRTLSLGGQGLVADNT